MNSKTKYIVKAGYKDGGVWVIIRTWDKKDFDDFYNEQKKNGIKSLTVFPFAEFDKDDNTGRWWNVYDPKRSI